jgi:hypothetical protein
VVARRALGCLFVAAVAACGPATPPAQTPGTSEQGLVNHAQLATDDDSAPPYGRDELDRALASERAAVTRAKQVVAADEADPQPSDRLPGELADLAVRRRFVAGLETCSNEGRSCPPRLDEPAWSYDPGGTADPKLDSALRFDRADWERIAEELHGRACACRTASCVDSMFVAIDVLENRPMPDVVADDAASQWITRARECLARLGGQTH